MGTDHKVWVASETINQSKLISNLSHTKTRLYAWQSGGDKRTEREDGGPN